MSRSFAMCASLLALGTLVQACRPDAESIGLTGPRLVADAATEEGPRWSDWTTPINLGPLINAAGFDQSGPALSRDGLSLYFASSRRGLAAGRPKDRCGRARRDDLWVAQRPSRDDAW